MSTDRTKEHQGSLLRPLLMVPLAGISAYLLVAVTPYFMDASCSKTGHSPASLTSCLPDAEIAKTDWGVSIPIDGVSYDIARDEPLVQAAPPLIFGITFYATGAMLLSVIVIALIRQSTASASQPIAIKVSEPWEDMS